MSRKEIDYREVFKQTVEALSSGGALLVSQGKDGKPNAMTIGWGLVGTIWGRPIFLALVRPSRYSYQLCEQSAQFSINVLPAGMERQLAFCGSKSGRDFDKFAECGFEVEPGVHIKTPGIKQASIIYECQQVQKTDLDQSQVDPSIISRFYASGDYHRLYFGEIMACRVVVPE